MLPEFLSTEWIVIYGGLIFTILIVFSETSFPVGVILPGSEILLFVGGLLAGTKWIEVSILFMIIPVTLSAFTGNLTGYTIGTKMGAKAFEKNALPFLKRKYMRRTEAFNNRFGSWALFIAHFVPIIRTTNPLYHGALEKSFQRYFIFSGISCILFVNTMILCGYFTGRKFPYLIQYMEYIIAAVVLFIFITPIVHLIRRGLKKPAGKLNNPND